MTPIFKSLFASLTITTFTLMSVLASPQGGAGDGSFSGSGFGSYNSDETLVPVSPIKIAAETDFMPINNVLPIVNILGPEVNDYSDEYDDSDYYNGNYDYGANYDYGNNYYREGMPDLGLA
ncbi:hypothetical protein EDD11_003209 [Mortierella claussenii]|nr:hypothetical protein EDD11_003209 [Mortierella claussenii]